jgi:phage shock protein A
MALITRVSRLFQADFHAVLDRIEEPDVLLRHAIREMEEELGHDEQRIRVLTHEQGQITKRETVLEQSLNRIEEELDLCFDTGKDDLARALIRRKLETQRFCEHLSRKCADTQDALTDLAARIKENRERLASMRQKAELLAREDSTHPAGGWNEPGVPEFTVCDEDVDVAFLREQQRRIRS